MLHPSHAEAEQPDGVGKLGQLSWLVWRGCVRVPSQCNWYWVPALNLAQPSSEILSQLFLFFIFLTERPLSGQSTFMHWVYPPSHNEWGTTLKGDRTCCFPVSRVA